MPLAMFLERDGTEHCIEVRAGVSLMECAKRNGVPGIEGDCGGVAACATCHVYIAPPWRDRIAAASGDEIEMLECANDVTSDSRLSCQVIVSDDLDGIVVRLPASQR